MSNNEKNRGGRWKNDSLHSNKKSLDLIPAALDIKKSERSSKRDSYEIEGFYNQGKNNEKSKFIEKTVSREKGIDSSETELEKEIEEDTGDSIRRIIEMRSKSRSPK